MTDAIEQIEGRWTLQILLCLNAREHRFSDLKGAIPRISSNILTDRLRAMERMGLIARHPLPPPAAGQVYALAKAAAGLEPILDALANWQAQSAIRAGGSTPTADHKPRKKEHSR